MAVNEDLLIRIKADTDSAIKGIDDLTKSVDKLKKTEDGSWAKRSDAGFKDVTKSANGLSTTLKGLAAGLLTFQTAMGAIDLAKMAADAEQAGDAFERVVEGMGKNAIEEFERIKEASKGLISESDIRQSATTALSLGVPLEKLAELMEVARVKSREMGTDVKSAFADLATGIGRGSPMILDNLGLTLKLGDAYKNMAKELNKSVDQLTKQEQTLALTNAVIRAGAKSVERYSDATLTTKERMQAMNASLDDLKVKIGKALLPVMEDAVEAIGEWADSFDEADTKALTAGINSIVGAFKGLWSAVKLINDVAMPDWLAGREGAGYLDTVAEALGNIGEKLYRIEQVTKSMTGAEKLKNDLEAIREEVEDFDGTAKVYEDLSNNLIALYKDAQKLKQVFQETGSEEAKAQLEDLNKTIAELEKEISKLSKQRPFDAFKKDAQAAAQATKTYTEKEIKELEKLNTKRLKSSKRTLARLIKDEADLTEDILSLHKKLADQLEKIDNERFSSALSIESKIKDLEYSRLTEAQAYFAKQKEADEKLKKAKEALLAEEFEKYKEYMSRYRELTSENAGHEIKENERILVSKEETTRRAIEALKREQKIEEEYYRKKADQAKKAHDLAVQQKEAEVQALKMQLQAQKALIEASRQLAEAMSGNKIEIDTTAIDEMIAKIDNAEEKIKTLEGTPVEPKAETRQLVKLSEEMEAFIRKTQKPVEIKVESDADYTKKDIERIIAQLEKEEVNLEVDADTKKAEQETEKTKDKIKEPVTIDVDTDPDTREADAARDRISQPITVPVYYRPVNSPPAGTTPAGAAVYPARTGAMTSTYTTGVTPIVVPTQEGETKVDVYFNIDGQKLKAVMEKNTINNIQDYLFREGGL